MIKFVDIVQSELDVSWDVELYGELLKIGGGKERSIFYFLFSHLDRLAFQIILVSTTNIYIKCDIKKLMR